MSSPSHELPAPLVEWMSRSFTCEFGTVTSTGQPLTHPITPHASRDGRTIDLATGLAYPLKAERARRHRRVGILFSDPKGSGMRDAPVVLVKGEATVRDADLQANTDRYVALSATKFATISRFIPARFQRAGAWYFARIWIHVTPMEVVVFPANGDEPTVWRAPEGTVAPPSDPRPAKAASSEKPAFESPADFRSGLAYSVTNLGDPVVTVLDDAGYPIPSRMIGVRLEGDELVCVAPRHSVAPLRGKVCVTFHAHPERFTSQENLVFVGEAIPTESGARVHVERQIGSFTLGRSVIDTARSVFGHAKDLHSRAKAEAARRGQPLPLIRMRGELR